MRRIEKKKKYGKAGLYAGVLAALLANPDAKPAGVNKLLRDTEDKKVSDVALKKPQENEEDINPIKFRIKGDPERDA